MFSQAFGGQAQAFHAGVGVLCLDWGMVCPVSGHVGLGATVVATKLTQKHVRASTWTEPPSCKQCAADSMCDEHLAAQAREQLRTILKETKDMQDDFDVKSLFAPTTHAKEKAAHAMRVRENLKRKTLAFCRNTRETMREKFK